MALRTAGVKRREYDLRGDVLFRWSREPVMARNEESICGRGARLSDVRA